MPRVLRFSYTRLFVQELRDEGNGLKRIITSPSKEELGLLTDGQARYGNGIQRCGRDIPLHSVEIEAEGRIADCWHCMDVEVYLLHGYPIRFDA